MRHDDDDNDDGESESNSSTDDAVENAKRDLQRHLLNDYVLVNISQFKKRLTLTQCQLHLYICFVDRWIFNQRKIRCRKIEREKAASNLYTHI